MRRSLSLLLFAATLTACQGFPAEIFLPAPGTSVRSNTPLNSPLSVFDANDDGQVTFDEFHEGMSQDDPDVTERESREQFNRLDENKDGVLDARDYDTLSKA